MVLNHYLAQAGICSRRKAVQLIKDSLVTVNGVVVTNPAYQVKETDAVKCNNKLIKHQEKIYLLLNKPKGYVTTASDELGRKTVFDLVSLAHKTRLFTVGRLDKDTTGLIVLTNDGDLAQKLAHPRYQIKKIYEATLDKPLPEEDMLIIKKGIRLRDGIIKVDALASFDRGMTIKVTLHSGKKRVIRRIFEALDYKVKKLDRINYAGLAKKGLQPGAWRFLTAAEISLLKK
jgi:23S rRNA pseudouridine2605 synthase